MTPLSSKREALRFGLVAVLGLAGRAVSAATSELPHPVSLELETEKASAAERPLVVLFSLQGCPYCEVVRRSYLVPMRAAGGHVVQLEMRKQLAVIGFLGETTTLEALTGALKIKVAPTVVFMGAKGVELAERISGVPLLDFYGAYLDERVAHATAQLRGKRRSIPT